jgi:hypothetical protein
MNVVTLGRCSSATNTRLSIAFACDEIGSARARNSAGPLQYLMNDSSVVVALRQGWQA